jgi:hypothetical protein
VQLLGKKNSTRKDIHSFSMLNIFTLCFLFICASSFLTQIGETAKKSKNKNASHTDAHATHLVDADDHQQNNRKKGGVHFRQCYTVRTDICIRGES